MLNDKELMVLKACADNALDAAGGDFGFTDEVPAYIKEHLTTNQVKGYLSSLQSKGMIMIDSEYVDNRKITQLTLDKDSLIELVNAGLVDDEYVQEFDCWHRD